MNVTELIVLLSDLTAIDPTVGQWTVTARGRRVDGAHRLTASPTDRHDFPRVELDLL